MIGLYLDDERSPKTNTIDWVIVRSYNEALSYVLKNGCPSYISFDHDLGWDNDLNQPTKSGYDFAKWLVESDLSNLIKIPSNFQYNVHSANPQGRDNIEGLFKNYLKFKENNS